MRAAPRIGPVIAVALLVSASVTNQSVPQAPRTQTPGSASTPADATGRIVNAARALVATLDEAGAPRCSSRSTVRRRRGGRTFRSGIFQREGMRLGDLTPPQRAAVMNLLPTALSADGYRKVTEIMRGDEVLRTTEQLVSGRGAVRRWRTAGAAAADPAVASSSARTSTTSRSSARRRRRRRGCCSSAVITSRST